MGNEMGNQNVTGIQEKDNEDAANIMSKSLNASSTSNPINGYLEHDKQDFKQNGKEDITIDKHSTALIMSNDADYPKDVKGEVLSDKDEILDENIGSAHGEPPPADDNSHGKQTSERVEDEKRNSVLDRLPKNEEAYLIPSVDLELEDKQEQTGGACDELSGGIIEKMASNMEAFESDAKCDEFKISVNDRIHEIIIPNSNQILENNINSWQVDNKSSEEGVLMDGNTVDKNDKRNGEKDFAKTDVLWHDCMLQREKSLSTESIDTVFLDAIDTEIKSLLREDDQKAIEESSISDPREHGEIVNVICDDCNKETLQDIKKDDIQIDNFHPQAKTNDISQGKQEVVMTGIDDVAFEQPVQASQIKMTETSEEEQWEYNSSSMPKDFGKVTEDEEIAKGKELPVSDEKQEENMEHESMGQNEEHKLVRHNEVSGKRSSESNPVATVNEAIVVETAEISTKRESTYEITISDEGLGSKINILEGDIISVGERLSSQLPDTVDAKSSDTMEKKEENNAEERTETTNQIKEVPHQTTSEKEEICEINLVETESQPLPLAELADLKVNSIQANCELSECSEELEQKEAAEESDMLIQKDLSSSSHVSECLDIYSVLPNLTEAQPLPLAEPSDLKFNMIQLDLGLSKCSEVLEHEETAEDSPMLKKNDLSSSSRVSECLDIYLELPNLIDKSYISTSESDMKRSTQNEINISVSNLKTRAVLKVEDSERILNPVVESDSKEKDCSTIVHASADTDLEAFQSNRAFTPEPNEKKLHAWTANDTSEGYNLEKSSGGTVLLKQEDSEEVPPLPPVENVKHHMIEESERNPSNLATSDKGDCDENTKRHHQSSGQEASSLIGAETAVMMLQSNNEEFDNSPLLPEEKPKGSQHFSLERSDSRKLQAPLLSLMKEVHAEESPEKKAGLSLRNKEGENNEGEVWKSPAKEFNATPARGRGKQKHTSSFFSSCICCTTAMS